MCGKPLVVPEAAQAVPAPDAPSGAEQTGTPWERRAELGFGKAWLQTVQLALLEPGKLFRQAQPARNLDQLWFALITGSVFSAINQLLGRLFTAQTQQLMRQMSEKYGGADNPWLMRFTQQQEALSSPAFFILALLFTPAMVALFLYLNAGVTHLFALLFGQAKRGFPATFAACAYAMATCVLFAIPGCGSFIGLIWMIVLIGIGLKETHGIGAGGATAAVLAPYAIFCCVCFGGLAMLALSAAKMAGH